MTEFFYNYKEIDKILKDNGVKKPFICCTKSFQKTDVFKFLQSYSPVVFDNIRPNPRFDDMVTAAELFRKEECDFMIAGGGGSPMDSAKMIRLMATNDIDTCLDKPMENNDIKALFIPTTAGTGSEATKTSVFYINENEKTSRANYDFIPDYVLFDSRLLETLSLYQKKCTCLDALCHAIESYFSTKATTESKVFAKKAIELFLKAKDGYIANTPDGNYDMLMASYYGGCAINLTGTTAAHAMCYNITMNCKTAHGHSVAAALVEIWKYMLNNCSDVNDSRGREYVEKTFKELDDIMNGNALETFKNILEEFNLEKPKTTKDNIAVFADKVPQKKLLTNPYTLTVQDIENIYSNILL